MAQLVEKEVDRAARGFGIARDIVEVKENDVLGLEHCNERLGTNPAAFLSGVCARERQAELLALAPVAFWPLPAVTLAKTSCRSAE